MQNREGVSTHVTSMNLVAGTGGSELMAEPMKRRALTYTEMMNGGHQQLDEAEHVREQDLQQRLEDLETAVDQLEQALEAED